MNRFDAVQVPPLGKQMPCHPAVFQIFQLVGVDHHVFNLGTGDQEKVPDVLARVGCLDAFDLDGDNDVTLIDFALLLDRMTGP